MTYFDLVCNLFDLWYLLKTSLFFSFFYFFLGIPVRGQRCRSRACMALESFAKKWNSWSALKFSRLGSISWFSHWRGPGVLHRQTLAGEDAFSSPLDVCYWFKAGLLQDNLTCKGFASVGDKVRFVDFFYCSLGEGLSAIV